MFGLKRTYAGVDIRISRMLREMWYRTGEMNQELQNGEELEENKNIN
jgi:hypothetical protein